MCSSTNLHTWQDLSIHSTGLRLLKSVSGMSDPQIWLRDMFNAFKFIRKLDMCGLKLNPPMDNFSNACAHVFESVRHFVVCLDSQIKLLKVFTDNVHQYESGGTFFVGFIIEYLEKLNAIILIIYSSRPFNVVCEHRVFALRGSD